MLEIGLPMLSVLLILIGVLLMARRRRQRRNAGRRTDAATGRQPRRSSSTFREEQLKRELEDLAVQIHDMSRQATAQANNRTAVLEKAIRDADERQAAMQATLEALNKKLKEVEEKNGKNQSDSSA